MYCSICLTTNNRLPNKMYCKNGHTFHTTCMDKWRSLHNECPECREHLLSATNYNLRSRIIKECDWDNVERLVPKFKDINNVIDFSQQFIKSFQNTPTREGKFFKIFELYCVFIKNWEMMSNEYEIFELYRKSILNNIAISTVLFKYGTIEFTKVREMLSKFQDLQLDYIIAN